MSLGGTASYTHPPRGMHIPPRVRASVDAAEAIGFEHCIRPETGRLLQALAAGVPGGGRIGEAGTGTGTGVAWMTCSAHPEVSVVSFEIDPARADAARAVHADDPRVEIVTGDAAGLFERGPFDLLVLDGGPAGGKHTGAGPGRDAEPQPVDPDAVLSIGGIMTVDDFTPATTWPPRFRDEPDRARIHWVHHPSLHCTELRVAEDLSVIVGRRHGGG
ncbi:MAG: SAM-dependent methyltransferase [Actinobacteria bacterium]|nr:SAM-dependent methyltransferase [Actinomycetota bacterium]NIS28529.1 SAM-dependent methyltransferase [Actinomycetota bacterium]NIT93995.1 SAM-dependent methyltransferase [Actinomycetota bacterium]NIU17633.1 SAM-dependent methyltransferase [Actinomycetota bacterium]NIU64000.1 SAM-dependent methyltransferase [Actinomycetota bacterium]